MKNMYPWCIVAYDTVGRTVTERIDMIKELGFEKHAYDWRDRHLDSTYKELKYATENDVEVLSVWLWLNAKRDSIGKLSPSNDRILETVKKLNLKTTIWVSLSGNFFKDLNQKESLEIAVKMIDFVTKKANKIDCKVALYNHSGWFGNPYNQLQIINALPEHQLSLVYNFHHAHDAINNFQALAKTIQPHLSAVNLNGMRKGGPKILGIGNGDFEKQMIETLKNSGFNGPWGILGHVENSDVKMILEENLEGLANLNK